MKLYLLIPVLGILFGCLTGTLPIYAQQVTGQKGNDLPAPLKTRAGTTVYSFVQKPAVYPGGTTALQAFLRQEMAYLALGSNTMTNGMVVLGVVVNEVGMPEDITMVESKSNPPLDPEKVLKVLARMPAWVPARQGSRPVAFFLPVPVKM